MSVHDWLIFIVITALVLVYIYGYIKGMRGDE
jgi:hypothetical protein